MSAKLFVGNLSFNTTENDLQDAFAAHGTVEEANLMMDRATGRPRGFAFVTMSTPEEAQKAIDALNGKELDGRALTVNIARPREERRAAVAAAAGAAVTAAVAAAVAAAGIVTDSRVWDSLIGRRTEFLRLFHFCARSRICFCGSGSAASSSRDGSTATGDGPRLGHRGSSRCVYPRRFLWHWGNGLRPCASRGRMESSRCKWGRA